MAKKNTDSDRDPAPVSVPLLFGCVSGALGCLLPVRDAPLKRRLQQLARLLPAALPTPLGGLPRGDWRTFRNDSKRVEQRGFLDGDLLERFLHLPRAAQQKLVAHIDDRDHDRDKDHRDHEDHSLSPRDHPNDDTLRPTDLDDLIRDLDDLRHRH